MSRKQIMPAVLALVVATAACSDSAITGPTLSPESPSAIISFDPATGIGTIGKGDIMQLLGLKNNAAAQAWYNEFGETVEFELRIHAKYEYNCVGLDNKSEPASKDGSVVVNVDGEPFYQGRGQSNWAGFNLTGGDLDGNGKDVPVEGEECSQGNVDGLIEDVTIATNPAPTNELTMSWGDNESVVIPF